ncbi:MAG: hypothetical protein FWC70_11240 [Defluviitaleaceae bacterium]|nr:hypothetical protein [Defluviitaleaceae bacterium]
MEVGGGAADVVFLLMDDDYLHFAFETGHSGKKALVRCASYDLRLFKRDGRTIHTVVIYTADVKSKPEGLSIGSLAYTPDVILMGEYDGNTIFAELEAKIKAGQELTDLDMLNLVLLPLMRHTMPRRELAAKSIELAQTIPDTTKRNACIAAAFAFASKYLNEDETQKLLEVLRMTDLGTMLVLDAVKDEKMETVKNALHEGIPIRSISRITGIDEATIRRIQAELNIE